MPGMVGGFGNFFVPLLIGAKEHLISFFYIIKEDSKIVSILSKGSISINKCNQVKIVSYHKNESSVLNAYLTGLFEGDGHIVITKKESSIRKIVIGITFNLKDLPLCNHLNLILGDGYIRIKDKENACVLIFHTDNGIIKIINLINGYLRSPKLYKFNLTIDYLNEKYSLGIPKYDVDRSNIRDNSWFAGFVDADGGFFIRYSDKKKFRIACELRIEQRIIYTLSRLSYEHMFSEIAELLGSKLEISTHNGKKYFLVRGSNRKSLKLILNYYNNFSLYSSKYLDYNNWSFAAKLLLENKAYSVDNRKIIYDLKHGMNNKRMQFNWNHLESLR
jgi:hypothetical protein